MNISCEWLKEYIDFSMSSNELDHVLTMLGIEIEGIVEYKKKFENFVIAKVVKKEKHPDADKLSVCKVNYGSGETIVVCGAPNVAEGQKVALGLVGAVVPSGNFTIEKRAIRSIDSNGMLCSLAELELGEDKSGIWILPDDAPNGEKLADYLKLNDTILEISVTPNRADCLSHIGVAREIAAYNNNKIKYPKIDLNESGDDINKSIEIIIEDCEKCPRYSGRVIKDVSIKESPQCLKNKLTMLGLRPINIAVDVTNYVLMECGQPLHAFDLDKLEGKKIIVKTAKEGEKFTTLDSKERTLDSEMLMICDGVKPIAIGGVMGGENSEISNETRNILLESAYFNPSSIRRTAKKLGIQSDASYRFERGVDIDNVTFALDRAASLIAELSGGTVEKGRIDVYPKQLSKSISSVRYRRACEIIGVEISPDNIKDILTRLNFKIIEEDSEKVTVEAPSYRVDMGLEIDLIEEIARLYNYDNIESDYTTTINFGVEKVHDSLAMPTLRDKLRAFLVENGFHEILTQNMLDPVSAKIFTDDPLRISNPLGEELSIMRPSLVPSLLRTIERNLRVKNNDLRLFEFGKSFHKDKKYIDTFIPGVYEKEELLVAITGKNAPLQWVETEREVDFYDIKGIFENLLRYFKFDSIELKIIEEEQPVFSKNSLAIVHNNNIIGRLGEIKNNLAKIFSLDCKVYLILCDAKYLFKLPMIDAKYSRVAPFPGIVRDLAFITDENIASEDIRNEILSNSGEYLKSLVIFDVYKGKNIEDGKKSIAFSLAFSSSERTLTDEDVEKVIENTVIRIEKKFGASLRKF